MTWNFRDYKSNDAFKGYASNPYKQWVRTHRDLAILRARTAGRSRAQIATFWGVSAARVTAICSETRFSLTLEDGHPYAYRLPSYDPILRKAWRSRNDPRAWTGDGCMPQGDA
jgi:hypothetical protein